jgi:L-serine dehydratase
MFQYDSGQQLLELCESNQSSIAEIAVRAEIEESGRSRAEIWSDMDGQLRIMEQSIHKGLEPEIRSMGGLIGGNAYLLYQRMNGDNFGNRLLLKAASYALAVTEVNASMGKIVAAPTGGASGIVPGILFALREEKAISWEVLIEALFVAAATGKIIALNATLSGAEGGCQAECGSAAAMAAAAAVYMGGGDPHACLDAASISLKGQLGLICDPVAGLVEVPCSKRNAGSVANALVCAEMALAGIHSAIPFDEVVEAMMRVGKAMSPDFKETARGGCAATPTGVRFSRTLVDNAISSN